MIGNPYFPYGTLATTRSFSYITLFITYRYSYIIFV